MRIIKAENLGFCFGVRNAVKKATDAGNVATLGELIHNDYVINKLASQGVKAYDNIDDIPKGTTVIIRSHGESEEILKEAEEKGYEYLDCTCPKVRAIQQIVNREYKQGKQIVIYGREAHPEVIGHNGWCGNTAIVTLDANDIPTTGEAVVVAQTTENKQKWEEFKSKIKNSSAKVYDTICDSTEKRQQEAIELASKYDAIVVIGSQKSSNTKKLYDVAKYINPNTFFIESVADVNKVRGFETVAVISGSSAPDEIIEEAIKAMAEETKSRGDGCKFSNEKSTPERQNFEELLNESLKEFYTGDVVTGTVIEVTPTMIVVDLGYKMDGIIQEWELSFDSSVKTADVAKVGDTITAQITRISDVDGIVGLSLKRLEQSANAEKLENAEISGEILKGKVAKALDGGLIVNSLGARVFIPASQVANKYVEDLSDYVGKEVEFKVIDVNKRRKRITGSIKQANEEVADTSKAEFWENVEVGKKYKGTVKTITSFGAFISLGGADGLLHISELSWDRVEKVEDVLKEGEEIVVYVKDIDEDNKKISLGYKDPSADPWGVAVSAISVGDVLPVKIVRFAPFGAFAEITEGLDGLIHVSEIDVNHVDTPQSKLKEGQEIEAKVMAIDKENKKISLSIAALMEGYAAGAKSEEITEEETTEE